MNIPIKSSKYSAPGQYLGYALQPVRLCYHLLNCPAGAFVSLEHTDDVSVHYADGHQILEQTKSALKQNPISDWADDLWKTIANWLTGIKGGDVDAASSEFRLYVTPVHHGALATALSLATTTEQVAAATELVNAELAKRRTPPNCMLHLKVFLDATDQERFALISRMTIESKDSDPGIPLRALLDPTVPATLMDLVCNYAIGNAKERADRLIRNNKPAILSGDEFKKNFHAFVQSNNLPGYLKSLSPTPGSSEVGSVISTRPTFIRQLELIEATEDQCVRAASDYLRTSADKALWADAGLIFQGALDDWDDDLVRKHGFVSSEIADTQGHHPPEARGRLTYNRCSVLQPPLDGREVPGHFVHGSFNALADDTRLGWHPDYKALLDGLED
jgi:hypothetical protein